MDLNKLAEIEAHLRSIGISERALESGVLAEVCMTAIDMVDAEDRKFVIPDKDGNPMFRMSKADPHGDGDTPWTAEKFVKDLSLDKFLRKQ